MAEKEIIVPTVGESVSKGILTAWLKEEGAYVREEDELFEIETDKATVSVPSPAAGVLHILIRENHEVEIGQIVARLDTDVVRDEGPRSDGSPSDRPKDLKQPETVSKHSPGGQPVLSPAVRRVVAEHDLEAGKIEGTGKGGRITKADALRAASSAKPERVQTRTPMSPIRRRIAARLVEAQQNTAHLTTFNEIDMGQVIDIRAQYRDAFEKEHGVRLGFMSFFVKACCHALSLIPETNAMIDGDDIVYNSYFDIGVAVATDRGLVVPVIRDADTADFAEIEQRIATLAQRARDKKLTPDELQGGTFTITNGGVFGSLLSTPIINYPQSAILGMHAIQKRPVVVEDEIAIRPMMYVALSYDHRLVDGREAVSFLVKVKELIEDPRRLLLRV